MSQLGPVADLDDARRRTAVAFEAPYEKDGATVIPAAAVGTHTAREPSWATRRAGRLDATRLVTHRFGMDEVPRAYDVFSDPVASDAIEVAVTRS